MRIDRVLIEGFQAHERLEFEPSLDGLTVLSGPTDAGKSSVVRAIRWALANKPAGLQHVGSTGRARVVVEFTGRDGRRRVVERIRSAKVNRYVLDGERYDGFGSGVPPAIEEAVGGLTVDLAGRPHEVAHQMQHDPPFLLTVGGAERSKVLDAMAGNDVAAAAVDGLNADVARHGRAEAEARRRIEDLEREIEGLGHVEEMLREASEAVALAESAEAARSRASVLSILERRACQYVGERESLVAKIEASTPIDVDELSRAFVAFESLEEMRRRAEGVRRKMEAIAFDASNCDVGEAPDLARRAVDLAHDAKMVALDFDRVRALAESRSEALATAVVAGNAERVAVEDLVELIAGVDSCPVCGSEVDADALEKVKERAMGSSE